MAKKYIIVYTVNVPEWDTVHTKCIVFDTLEDAKRNAEYLAEGEGATPVEIYESNLISTINVR